VEFLQRSIEWIGKEGETKTNTYKQNKAVYILAEEKCGTG
jgi:hypothetical protein